MGQSTSFAGVASARFAVVLIEHLRDSGVDPAAVYGAARVAAIEQAGPMAQIPAQEWMAMCETAAAATGDADLPLRAGASMRNRHLGVLGYVFMSCATLGESVAQMQRYIGLVQSVDQPEFVRVGDVIESPLEGPYGSALPPAIVQFRLASRAVNMRWLTGRADLAFDASFRFAAPRDTRAYAQVFGGRLQFGAARTLLSYPAAWWDLPISSADPEMNRSARERAEALLREVAGEDPFLREVRLAVARALPAGEATLQSAARALSMSARTLHRRLAAHGHGFSGLLGEVRRSAAETYLREPGTSLAEIAFLLGYSEQSAFQQAFKRWTGTTPGEFRAGCEAARRQPANPAPRAAVRTFPRAGFLDGAAERPS